MQAVRIDVDTDQQAVARFNVMSIPTLLLFRDGAEVIRLDGLIREHDIDEAIRSSTGP